MQKQMRFNKKVVAKIMKAREAGAFKNEEDFGKRYGSVNYLHTWKQKHLVCFKHCRFCVAAAQALEATAAAARRDAAAKG